MHRTRYNAAVLQLELSPDGPLLIKAGGFTRDPSLPDMPFVRTARGGEEWIYVPGSSMKGVVRSFVEKALRTFSNERPANGATWRWACDTFPRERNCCGDWLGEEEDGAKVYAGSCGACRLFGNTRLRGRVAFGDLMPKDARAVVTETRYGVAISRLSHAVAQGPFEMEAAVSGSFVGQVVLENYEIWQLGLLAVSFSAMDAGILQIGFGKNRGFGHVKVTVRKAQFEEVEPVARQSLRGLRAFVGPEDQSRYALAEPESLEELPEPVAAEDLGFYTRRTYDNAGWSAIAKKAMAALQI